MDRPGMKKSVGPDSLVGEDFYFLQTNVLNDDNGENSKMTERVRSGRALAKVLKNEGTRYIFTVAVSAYMPFYAGCIDEGIEIINVRHEQAAAYAADAWGRISRQPGVCWAIGGCGATNMTTALVGAYYECSPVVGLFPVAESGEPVMKDGESQQFSATRMFEPYVKWGKLCSNASELANHARWAYRHAMTGRMGPVILEFPHEILFEECDYQLPPVSELYRASNRQYIDQNLAKQAIKMVSGASRPIIIIGNGVHWSDAGHELVEFARLLGIPVVSKAGLSQGYFPEDDVLFAGVTIGFERPNSPAQIVPKADLIITIGSRYEVMSAFPRTSQDAKLIQIDIEPTEIGRHRAVDMGIIGDARAVLWQLVQAAKELGELPRREDWLKLVREERQKYEESIRGAGLSQAKPIKTARLVREIGEFLDKDAYVIIDGADVGAMGRTYLRARLPGHFMIAHGNYGNMGPGVAFALGVKLSKPENQVLVLTSDGSFGFNAMELETASKYHIKIVVVVGNNRAWGAEWGPAIRMAGRAYMEKVGVWLPDATRYDKLAEALGCHGELVSDPNEIAPALKRAFEADSPSLLDVRVVQEDMWPARTNAYPQLEEYVKKVVAK